jgi:methylamine dehydrogenase heavy chain
MFRTFSGHTYSGYSNFYRGLMALLTIGVIVTASSAWAQNQSPPPLPSEAVPNMVAIPAVNASRIYAHDAAFYSLTSGKIYILDVGAESRNVIGILPAAQFPSFQISPKRQELYIAETFYSRGTRGTQTDVLTIYDERDLSRLGEIILEGNKRLQSVPQKGSLAITEDEKFLLVFNFTPASSVYVIDLETRKVVNEIETNGCMLVYSTAKSNFLSQCSDGSMMSFSLSTQGRVERQERLENVFDIDGDPLFMNSVTVNNVLYFVSFSGSILGIETKRGKAQSKQPIALEARTSQGTPLSPSGWQVITADQKDNIYILMRENAGQGDHKYGGSYVAVYSTSKRKIVRLIHLLNEGLSIEVTSGKDPYLVVTRSDMQIDIYTSTGQLIRTIGDMGPAMPMSLHRR